MFNYNENVLIETELTKKKHTKARRYGFVFEMHEVKMKNNQNTHAFCILNYFFVYVSLKYWISFISLALYLWAMFIQSISMPHKLSQRNTHLLGNGFKMMWIIIIASYLLRISYSIDCCVSTTCIFNMLHVSWNLSSIFFTL